MEIQIEELRKFTNGPVTQGKLDNLRAALAAATALFQSLDAKSEDEDDIEEFETVQSDVEYALEELSSACDELEAAEDKDERADAQEQISDAIEEVLTHFDELMPLAVKPVSPQLISEYKKQMAEIHALPKEEWGAALIAWMDSSLNPEDRSARLKCILSSSLADKPASTE